MILKLWEIILRLGGTKGTIFEDFGTSVSLFCGLGGIMDEKCAEDEL